MATRNFHQNIRAVSRTSSQRWLVVSRPCGELGSRLPATLREPDHYRGLRSRPWPFELRKYPSVTSEMCSASWLVPEGQSRPGHPRPAG